MEELKKKEFVIFDVETTGLSPAGGDRIVEVAALKIKNLKPAGKFCFLINPQREIPFGAFQVNGISQDMVQDAPVSRDVLPRFLEFIGEGILVAHNIEFDLSFVCYELSLIDRNLCEDAVVIDTLRMARVLLPNLGRYPLWFVAKSLGLDGAQKHRAMADVELTFGIFEKLVKLLGTRSLEEAGALPGVLAKYNVVKKQEEGLFKW